MRLDMMPKALEEILAYKNDRLLGRYAHEQKISCEEADRHFRALKEFLIVCAVKTGPKITSDPIDKIWHTFLLFTKDYNSFCEQYLGKFIHHEPFEYPLPETYLETRAFARDYFGVIDSELWPIEAKADCSSGCGE